MRETRRILGQYVLTEADVRGQARFADAIGLCNSPVDVHEPGGSRAIMDNVGEGYGIPFRCMLPAHTGNLIMAGRCISVDEVAYGSTRNVPACTMTGEAAAYAATIAAREGIEVARVPVADIQKKLRAKGAVLGTLDETTEAIPAQ